MDSAGRGASQVSEALGRVSLPRVGMEKVTLRSVSPSLSLCKLKTKGTRSGTEGLRNFMARSMSLGTSKAKGIQTGEWGRRDGRWWPGPQC